MRGKGVARAEKGITLVISKKAMDHIVRIIKSLKNSSALLDGVRETVNHEIKIQKVDFLLGYWEL